MANSAICKVNRTTFHKSNYRFISSKTYDIINAYIKRLSKKKISIAVMYHRNASRRNEQCPRCNSSERSCILIGRARRWREGSECRRCIESKPYNPWAAEQ